jgi:hypothetical protein
LPVWQHFSSNIIGLEKVFDFRSKPQYGCAWPAACPHSPFGYDINH